MAHVQGLFETFHSRIRTYYEINDELREKKDIIVRRVKAYLAKKSLPTCQEFLQGSYKMKVGILALKGAEYDIDVGLRFSFDETKYPATEVRGWVYDAVDGHTETVENKRSCIRVGYADGYHVDLVPYSWWDDATGAEQHRLAHKTSGWKAADPPGLIRWVNQIREPFAETGDSETQTDQFRRVVRYLKRWNDYALLGESQDKPSGLALLLLTAQHFRSPALSWIGGSDDRTATEQVARAAAATNGRIVALKPTPEYEEVFARISDAGMTGLKARFSTLRDALMEANNTQDEQVACKRLKEVFGPDFPCPDAQKSALKTSAPAIVPSSSSGS